MAFPRRVASLSRSILGLGAFILGLGFAPIAFAGVADNVHGWLWVDSIGWISVNDQDVSPADCPAGVCGTYGVHLDPGTRALSGFAWGGSAGWICVGASCADASCANDPGDPQGPTNTPQGGAPTASVDAGAGVVEARGWAKACALGSNGWISLNCSDIGACGGAFAYKVVYDTATQKFRVGAASPPANYSSLGWNGLSDGTGFGYVDFEYAYLGTGVETMCTNGLDDDFDGNTDCQDSSCSADPACLEEKPANNNCADTIDNDSDGETDCEENACYVANPAACAEDDIAMCANTLDDDGDGTADCSDADCAGFGACPPLLPGSEPLCVDGDGNPLGVTTCCTNGVNDDGPADPGVDCDDAACAAQEDSCKPAWLQTSFGNVYAQLGITGDPKKAIEATYCLLSSGAIANATSQECQAQQAEFGSVSMALPKSAGGYVSNLGKLDLAGIRAGRYGAVTQITGGTGLSFPDLTSQIPNPLNGQVIRIVGNATIGAKTFLAGTTNVERGNGLILVEGDLKLAGDLQYGPVGSVTALRTLPSLGIIVTKNAAGTKGNVTIEPTVSQLVGTVFVEDTISTGTQCTGAPTCPADVKLVWDGLIAARRFVLERNFRSQTEAAESFRFDGRGVANPPPGMQDLAKSLPSSRDAF